jgi:glycosyltransferase involved in cell wall biosynthesis
MGTQPGPYTYSFIEAWCTGIPVITWSKGLGGQIIGQNGGNSFEIPDFIDNGVDCISSDSKVELTYALKLLMSDDTFAKGLSEKGRIKCINMFNYSVAKSQWEDLLKQL